MSADSSSTTRDCFSRDQELESLRGRLLAAEQALRELRVKFEHREEQFYRLLEFSATNASPPLDDEDYRRATNDMPEKLAVGDVQEQEEA